MAIGVAPADISRPSAAPFLKWAGGKRQLLARIRRFYPADFSQYIEPFVGSGAVFFDLARRGALDGKRVVLTDTNADLIACYRALKETVEGVVAVLGRLEQAHRTRGAAFYYEVRDQRFNPLRRRLARDGAGDRPHDVELAAMLIYLNRTCFNGLFRLNSQGDFNTPVGRYANPTICDEANLRGVSATLNDLQVELRVSDFTQVRELAVPGAFVYFDPPYAPVSPTASFTSYTARRFSGDEQVRLRDLVVSLATRGVHVLLSNSVAPVTTRLYEHSVGARRAGLRAYRVPARRAINCDASARGVVEEYLVSNVPQREG